MAVPMPKAQIEQAVSSSQDSAPTRLQKLSKQFTFIGVTTFILFAGYAYLFWKSLSPYWFNPSLTTDDALQQIYQFHQALDPELFKNDLITEVMSGYLTPLHYWLSYGITYLTQSPIMMGHWVMLIQLSLTTFFVFFGVRSAAGTVPALFSVAWFFHTRNIVQRLTSGLVRGWSAPILTGYLYFVLRENHIGVLITLFFGCLLNPPATMIAAVSYGLLLLYRTAKVESRARYRKRLLSYLLLAPLYLFIVFMVVDRPESVGKMVTLEQASKMPEFDRDGGRFGFLPFLPAWEEINTIGMQAFVARWYRPAPFLKDNIGYIAFGLVALLLLCGMKKKRVVIPAEILIFGLSAIAVYFASRVLAFLLYVPDRHLQFPLAFFFIFALPIGFWRLYYSDLYRGNSYINSSWPLARISAVALTVLTLFVYVGSNDGLKGVANFNYPTLKRGDVFHWLRHNAPKDALIAGNPTHIDGVQLFAKRTAYATTETTHPFYLGYLAEMKRRLTITWRAYYATNAEEFVKLLEPEKIDYFVFERRDFYPEALKSATYFKPLHTLVQELAAHEPNQYFFKKLPHKVDLINHPYMVFKDGQSVIVDVAKLKQYLAANGTIG